VSVEQPCYLYGVVRARDVAGLPAMSGVAGKSVTAVTSDGLAAVLSELDDLELQASRADLLAHADVLQAVVDHCDVVPLSFGHLCHSAEQVRRELLERDATRLSRILDELHDTVELQVKATYVEEAVVAEVVRSDRKLQRLRGSTDHRRQIELGRRFASALEARRHADSARLVERVGRIADRAALGEPPGEFGVVDAAFLIPRGSVAAFLEEIDQAAAEESTITVRAVGPMAPYSFVGDVYAGAA
jgi:hypothetical protein